MSSPVRYFARVIARVVMDKEVCDAAERGDLAAVQYLIEAKGSNVNEEDRVRDLCRCCDIIIDISS